MEFNSADDFLPYAPRNQRNSVAPMNQCQYGYPSPACDYSNSTENVVYLLEQLEAMNGLHLSNSLDLPMNFGSPSLSCQDQQPLQLQRMRVDSAVRGQQVPPSRPQFSVPFMARSFQDLYSDPYYPAVADQSTNLQNRPRNMAAANFPSGITLSRDSRNNFPVEAQYLGSEQHQNFSSLENGRRNVAFLAKEYYPFGNHYLQKNFDEERQMENLPRNDLIQKNFVAISNKAHMTRTIALLVQDEQKFKDVCMDKQGSVAIQKLLENLHTSDEENLHILEQVNRVILALKRITVTLTKNTYGGNVIEKCLRLFSPALTQPIMDEVVNNCVDLATHKTGCSVINNYLGVLKEQVTSRLIKKIISYVINLAEDPYGNYVVQCVVKMRIPQINASIISRLSGAYAQLSMNKHASHVVEDLIKSSHECHAKIIILEILNSNQFLNILQDPFGNYVAQTALRHSKGALLEMFSTKVLNHSRSLHSHLYGKKVLHAFGKGFKTRKVLFYAGGH